MSHDQLDELRRQGGRHAGCPRVLVRSGLGRKTLEGGVPQYLEPVAVHDDLAATVDAYFATRRDVVTLLQDHERAG